MLVGPWIGCLASGLAHIHSQRVKHKDIKPSNILIHGTNPVMADMGISHRFENDSKSSGRSAGSFANEAPEVIEEQVRGRRQDVWSLLCCYMEILTFLKDVDRRTFHKSVGGRIYFYNYDSVVVWLNALKPHAVDEEELAFIQLLLDSFKRDPEERPYALDLAEQIQAVCKQRPHKYIAGRKTVREIETETFEENPPLFREYISATPDIKIIMDNQLKNVKTHSRLLNKGLWYDWRMALLGTLKEGLFS